MLRRRVSDITIRHLGLLMPGLQFHILTKLMSILLSEMMIFYIVACTHSL